jgi:hypothetical protein
LREAPKKPKAVRKDTRPFEQGQVVTTNVRRRMHESVGTGAEIGAQVGTFPNDDSLQFVVPGGTLPSAPSMPIDFTQLYEPPPTEAPEQQDVLGIANEPMLSVAPGYDPGAGDPNLLHPGQITVVPARLRGPHDQPPPHVPGHTNLGPVYERDVRQPASISLWLERVDWSALQIDAAEARKGVELITNEPGDSVKGAAALVHADNLTMPAETPTIESVVDAAMITARVSEQTVGMPATRGEAQLNMAATLKHRHMRHMPLEIHVRRIAAHKLGASHRSRIVSSVVAVWLRARMDAEADARVRKATAKLA